MKWVVKKFDELTSREIYEIIKARFNVFVVEQKIIYQDLDDKDFLSYHLFKVDFQGKVLAYCRILPAGISYKEASIGRVLTTLDNRRKNDGKVLLKKAIEFIENKLKESKIRISAQEYLVKFYEFFGFKIIGNHYLEDEILHIQMFYQKSN